MSGARRLVVVRGSWKRLMNGLIKLTALRRRRGRKKATIGLSHVSRSLKEKKHRKEGILHSETEVGARMSMRPAVLFHMPSRQS